MTQDEYRQLALRFCDHAKLDFESFLRDGALSINGVDFSVMFSPAIDSEKIIVRIDMGVLPRMILPQAYHLLLVANHELGLSGVTFGCVPHASVGAGVGAGAEPSVTLTTREPVPADMSGADFFRMLGIMGAMSAHWRDALLRLESAAFRSVPGASVPSH